LRRLSSWLRALTAPPPPLLDDGPLGIVPALVGELVGGQVGTEPDRAFRGADPDGRAAGRRAGDRGFRSDSRRRRRTSSSVVIPERAAAEVALPRAAVSVRSPLPSASERARGRKKRHGPLVDVFDGTSGQALAELLGERAVRRLVASAPAAGARGAVLTASDPKAPRGATGPASPSHTAARTVFDAQWSAALAGRAAPPELLRRLHERDRAAAADPQSASREPASTELPTAPASEDRLRETADELADDNGRPSLSGELDTGAARAIAPVSAGAAGRNHKPTFAPTPPVAAAPHGPHPEPLRALAVDAPARALGPPAEAASRLRLVASEGAARAAELDALAESVKRILDEEARRHGIDV
jgi:hypothetical protein